MLRVNLRPNLISSTLSSTIPSVMMNLHITELDSTRETKRCLTRKDIENSPQSKKMRKRGLCKVTTTEKWIEFHPLCKDSSSSPLKDQVHIPQIKKKPAQALTKINKHWFSTRKTRSRDFKICPMSRWDNSQTPRTSTSPVWSYCLISIKSCNKQTLRMPSISTRVKTFQVTKSEALWLSKMRNP